jgi:hypothetical protein
MVLAEGWRIASIAFVDDVHSGRETMEAERSDLVLGFFKALADADRLRLIGLLAERERSVAELATLLALKPPAVAHHLAKLKEAGLVSMHAGDTGQRYALDMDRLRSLRQAVLQTGSASALAGDLEGPSWEHKVLRDFFEGDRLKGIPSAAGKRAVIGRWFAARFTPGVRYREREVNALLEQHYEDSNTLRRLLIDHHLLQRTPDGREYWRETDTI